jgi:hypothetical protein
MGHTIKLCGMYTIHIGYSWENGRSGRNKNKNIFPFYLRYPAKNTKK